MHAAAPFIFSNTRHDTDPRPPGLFILLLGLLQGVLSLVAFLGIDEGWWPFQSATGRTLWQTLGLLLPVAMMLMVRRAGELRFWWQSLLLALLLSGPACWAGWSITGAPGLRPAPVLILFGLSMLVVTLMLLPYFQAALRHGRWQPHYPDLFEFAWQNILSLLLTAVFVGLCWGMLVLWSTLFRLIGLPQFLDLIQAPIFMHLSTGLMIAAGILAARTQQRPVQAIRQIIFSLLTGLLPLMTAICLAFAGSLLITGPQPLWATGKAGIILLVLLGLMTLMVNGVFQDTRLAMRYVRPVRWLIYAGMLVLPALAALALHALWLRIDQYGWTQNRIAALLLTVLLGLHAIGYAIAALMPGRERLAGMKPVNVATSVVAIITLLLLNSPLLDPHRITASSQLNRLTANPAGEADVDLKALRFNSGRQGWLALKTFHQDLPDDPALSATAVVTGKRESPVLPAGTATAEARHEPSSATTPPPPLAERLKTLLDSRSITEARSLEEDGPFTDDPVQLARQVRLAPGTRAAEAAWWQALVAQQNNPADCQWLGNECVLIEHDLDRDGRPERLLCNLTPNRWSVYCAVFHKPRQPDPAQGTELAGWLQGGTLSFPGTLENIDDIRQALRQGKLKARPPRWPDIEVNGVARQILE